MNNDHGDPFRGAEVPLDIQEHLDALMGWVAAHPEDEVVRRGLQALFKELEDSEETEKTAPLPDWTWTGEYPPPPRRWLIRGWMPAARVSMLAGRGGAGKSRLALQLAAGIASGGGEGYEWISAPLGELTLGTVVPEDGAPVIYATWEDEEEEVHRRLVEISGPEAPWVTPERLSENLHIVNLARRGPLWPPLQGRHVATLAELTMTGGLLRQRAEQLGAVLIIVDPLAAAYAADENSRGLVRAFVADWDGWAQESGCAVWLVAHPPKGGSDYSGSTDWEGAVRSMWVMKEEKVGEKPGKGEDKRPAFWQLSLPKRNYGPPMPPFRLIWDGVDGQLRWSLKWWQGPSPRPTSQDQPSTLGEGGGGAIDLTI